MKLASTLAVAVVLASRAAYGAPSAKLTYVREAGAERCADEQGLRRAVAARIGYDPFFVWAKVSVVAVVHRDAGAYRAEVTLVDEGGVSRGTRTLTSRGDDCGPLVSALALSISLALDPLSLRAPADPPPTPPEPPSVPEKVAPAPPEPQAPEPPPAPAPGPPAWRGWLGLAATVSDGLTPDVSFGGAARARFRRGWLSLGAELGADLAAAASVPAGGAIDAWTARGTLVACGHFSIFSGCAFGSGGALVASGEGLTTSKSAATAFGEIGPRLTVVWELSPRFTLDAFAEVGFVLSRRALQVGGVSAFQQSVAAPRIGLGISTRIF